MCVGIESSTVTRTTTTELPLADALLHGLQQVSRLQLLDLHIRIAGDAEWVCFQDLHPREQLIQVGRDHLFQPDKVVVVGRRAIFPRAAG